MRKRSFCRTAGRLISEYGVKLAMVTLGPKGCYLSNGHASAGASCPKVRPIDTTGAGDIFGGSAVSRLLRTGKRPEELSEEELYRIGAFACTAASLSTERPGGIPSIPAEDEVERAIPPKGECDNAESDHC